MLLLAQLRRLHVYLAMLAAPTLIFFSATGCLQLFSLHEAHGDYRPPVLLEKLAALHKDQVFAAHRHPKPAAAPDLAGADRQDRVRHDDDDHDAGAPASEAPAAHDGGKSDKTAHWTAPQLALKWVLAGASTAALISVLLGVWMGFLISGKKRLPLACFALGLIAPLALVFIVSG
ncbi:MAG: hypothetical protein JO303_07310 [Caulobacteraceae bacterium]|nr:hypothetical protein [Caulobacteraceae bacterium]